MTFLFFGLEFVVVSAILVTLYQRRARIGMYGVVVALASMQMLQALLASSFYWPVADGMLVSPGSSVLFASNLAILLVAYSFGGTRDARIVLYSVVGSNVFIATFGLLLSAHMAVEPPVNFLGVPAEVFSQGVRSAIVGILVLYLDQLLAILAFAFLLKKFPKIPHFIRFTLVLELALIFDTLAYVTTMFVGTDEFTSILTAGLVSKGVAGLAYGVIWGLLLTPRRAIIEDTLRDVLAGLFFRGETEKLEELALKDPLTNLYNRRFFEMCFDSLIEGYESTVDYQFAVVVFDVDTFKSVNDSLGHAGGDQILKDLAQVMRASIRDEDLAFRIGGDEFVLLLPHTKRSGALVVAERLNRAAVVHEKLDDPVTITIGIAVFPQDGQTRDELFEAADKRMYQGKDAGRNQIISE